MFLGGRSWLNAIARDADGAYGMAHGQLGLQSQAWYAPGFGAWDVQTIWEGETVYQPAHPTFAFSAWIEAPTPIGTAYAILQVYYGAAWHDLIQDVNPGHHWFDDANCTLGVTSADISALYSEGEVVRARLRTLTDGDENNTPGFVYRAQLTGVVGFGTWPTWPAWTTASAHTAAQFNMLRTAAEYLKACNERPWLGSEIGLVSHGQESFEPVLRWSFKLGGAQNLHMEITTSNCTAAAAPDESRVYVYIQDEQFPHGPNTTSRLAELSPAGGYTTNGAQTIDANLSGYTPGTRYCISVCVTHGVADPSPSAHVTALYLNDLAGVTRSTALGEFVYGNQPGATGDGSIDEIADDLEAMKPAAGKASPNWYEHEFVAYRGHDQAAYPILPTGLASHLARRWYLCHNYPYLRWRGAGRIGSIATAPDGGPLYSHNLTDTDPAGGAQILDLKALNWLAPGDWYAVADDGDNAILTAYEDFEA